MAEKTVKQHNAEFTGSFEVTTSPSHTTMASGYVHQLSAEYYWARRQKAEKAIEGLVQDPVLRGVIVNEVLKVLE